MGLRTQGRLGKKKEPGRSIPAPPTPPPTRYTSGAGACSVPKPRGETSPCERSGLAAREQVEEGRLAAPAVTHLQPLMVQRATAAAAGPASNGSRRTGQRWSPSAGAHSA